MAVYVQNNAYGGVSMTVSDTPLKGYTELTAAQAAALMAAGPGATINAQGGLVTPPAPSALVTAQQTAIQALYIQTRNLLLQGFTSTALGSSCTYPTNPTDQVNMQAAALAAVTATGGWIVPLWCMSGSTWSFTMHTAAQVQKVLSDWVTFRTACSTNLAAAVAVVNAAATVGAVQAVAMVVPSASAGL